jgi:molybdopterin synthase sulfur carrier subunit
MSVVRIPPVLRANAGGNKSVEVSGATVGDVLSALVGQYPGLRSQLLTDDGELNRFVNVYLNDQDIRYLQERGTPVDARDTLIILPAMAGGAGGAAAVGR